MATGVPSGGSESAEKRTKKEQFIAKLPNLKEKLHKKTEKHVVLSDHVVDSGGGGGFDGQDDTEGGGMGHNNQSLSASGAPSSGQTSGKANIRVTYVIFFILTSVNGLQEAMWILFKKLGISSNGTFIYELVTTI